MFYVCLAHLWTHVSHAAQNVRAKQLQMYSEPWRKFGSRIFVSPVPLAMHFRRRISFRIVVCILWRFPSKFVVMFMDVDDFVMLRSQTYARRSPLAVLG